jgi:nucleoside-diphosphate-sugar epimerase
MSNSLNQVTGISGFLGFRAAAIALDAGYHVRGVIRRPEQANTIKAAASVKAHLDRLEFVIVPDLLVEHAYDEALNGVDYVLHIASPLAEVSFTVVFPYSTAC